MASHPSFDPNHLEELGDVLANDANAPLLNRAAQGSYRIDDNTLIPFVRALFGNAASIGEAQRNELYKTLGFYNEPQLRMQVAKAGKSPENLRVSPLQMALAAAAMSNNGILPPPRIALATNTPQQGWVILPALGKPVEVLPAPFARETALELADNNPYWSHTSVSGDAALTWYQAGTLPDWNGTPLALVVLLEENNISAASQIGQDLLEVALQR
jgi:hypothetical protein